MLSFITLLDLIWLCINLSVCFIFNAGVKIYAELYAWVAVFMLPINSAINPVLYTLTTKLFKQQIAQIVYTWRAGGIPVASPPGSSGISMSSTPFNGRNSKNSVNLTTSDVRKVVYHLRTLSPLKLVHAYALQNFSLLSWKSSNSGSSKNLVKETAMWQNLSVFQWFGNTECKSAYSDKEVVKRNDLCQISFGLSKCPSICSMQYHSVLSKAQKHASSSI